MYPLDAGYTLNSLKILIRFTHLAKFELNKAIEISSGGVEGFLTLEDAMAELPDLSSLHIAEPLFFFGFGLDVVASPSQISVGIMAIILAKY